MSAHLDPLVKDILKELVKHAERDHFVFAFIVSICLASVILLTLPKLTKLQEIHVEVVLNNECWEALTTRGLNHTSTRLMLRVIPEWSESTVKLVKARYLLLRNWNYLLGLHVHHLGLGENASYDVQRERIEFGVKFLRELNISSEHFASGNWNYNMDTLRILRSVGVKVFHVAFSEGVEDLTGVAQLLGLNVVIVRNFVHDFELEEKEINPKWSFASGVGFEKLEDLRCPLFIAAFLLSICGVAWLILKRKERKE
jgi:hypothetical protein